MLPPTKPKSRTPRERMPFRHIGSTILLATSFILAAGALACGTAGGGFGEGGALALLRFPRVAAAIAAGQRNQPEARESRPITIGARRSASVPPTRNPNSAFPTQGRDWTQAPSNNCALAK